MNCAIQNCQICDTDITCKKCNSGFLLSLDTTNCLSRALCNACWTVNKVCAANGDDICLPCNGEVNFKGTICMDTNICASCSNAEICSESNDGTRLRCQACPIQTQPNSAKTVCLNTQNCKKCGSFQACVEVPQSLSLACVNCPDNMPSTKDKLGCLNAKLCAGCAMQNSICTISDCVKCLEGQVASNTGVTCEISEQCTKISPVCVSCSNNTCLQCDVGSQLANGQCIASDSCSAKENCIQCSASNPANCIVCKLSFRSRFGTCFPAECSSDQDCIKTNGECAFTVSGAKFACSCSFSSQISSTSICLNTLICQSCFDKQQVCSQNNEGNELGCTQCQPGSSYFNKKCVPNNCGSCSGNAICELVDFKTFECVPCQIGQLVSSDRTKCLENACLTNCKAISTDYECVEEFGSFACDCKIGFRYSRQQQRCLQSTCQECQNINSTLCILKQNNTFGCICADQKMLFRDSKCIPNCEIINGVSAFCNEQGVCGLNGQCVCNNNLNTEQNCASCVEGAFILDEKCISPSCGTQSHCNGRGICEKGFCRCHFGYIGSDCQQCIPGFIEVAGVCGSPSCQMEIGQCSGMGKCQNSICQCLKQNHGVDCEECHEGFIKAIDGTVVHCINLKNAVIGTGDILSILFGLVLAAIIVVFGVFWFKKCNRSKRQDMVDNRNIFI
ncbi:Cysteine-rich membrane protein 2 [Spironucleus salmonicida]|uniref:Cysteine-rich membrane protein 2 n=1 Tax=Spironucleus salmonicida TaxID=348837 RepID=A0A9P8LJW8_9EUKA|nr:Cysteine-rich membrane protein 2 [Spironucleus salmonicida]KAH0576745.1 Cysteine-rich membrane protein 2 [Spironucleus salmonicida]